MSAESEQVTRVRTQATLHRPEIARLIIAAVEACRMTAASSEVLVELDRTIARHELGVFVGFVDEQPRAIAVAELPSSVWQLAPFVLMAYAERASRQLRIAIGERLREWVIAAGYRDVMFINARHTDRSFLRAFRHYGKGSRYGSVLRFEHREEG